MTISHLSSGSSDWHDDDIVAVRADLLTRINTALEALDGAATALEMLQSPGGYDVEVAEGRDGRDIAAHLDGAVRGLRAAYAVAHMVFAKEAL